MALEVSPADAKEAASRRGRLRRMAPPMVAVALGLLLIVALQVGPGFLMLLPTAAVTVPLGFALLALCLLIGGYLMRRSADSETGRSWREWEAPEGTARGVPILYAVVVITGFGVWRAPEWWPLVAGLVVAAAVGSLVAVPRRSAEPLPIIPDQLAPDPIEEFELVTLQWDLAPAQPEIRGETSTWVRRSEVAGLRPPRNPTSKHVVGATGQTRPELEWYVREGRCDEVNRLADQLSAVSAAHGLSRYSELCMVLDLVQSIEYRDDDDARWPTETRMPEYWRFPLETIYDGGGDCEDHAILAVALLSAMGHRTCFFSLPEHAAVGVAGLPDDSGAFVAASDGAWFYYVETTADGWVIGELPSSVKREELEIGAIVEPLAHRKEAPDLVPTPRGTWRRETVETLLTLAGLAAVGTLLSFMV